MLRDNVAVSLTSRLSVKRKAAVKYAVDDRHDEPPPEDTSTIIIVYIYVHYEIHSASPFRRHFPASVCMF